METESLKSGFSDTSSSRHHLQQRQQHPIGLPPTQPKNGRRRERGGSVSSRSGSALSLTMNLSSTRAQSHHQRNYRGRGEEALLERDVSEPEEAIGTEDEILSEGRRCSTRQHSRDEVINVQPDDAWMETTTAITGNTSDRSNSPINGTASTIALKWAKFKDHERQPEQIPLGWIHRYAGSILSAFLVTLSVLSPIIMGIGPKLGVPTWTAPTIARECGTECHALVLTLAIKMVALIGAIWAVFWRGPTATMPRVFLFRSITLLLAFLATFTFWLFYWVRAEDELSTLGATAFAGGLADALLAIHYLGVLLVEIRQLDPVFQISILRSPDGIEKHYLIGSLSVQRAAVWVLQRYNAEFPAYNPNADRLPPLRHTSSVRHGSSFKFYDVEGICSAPSIGRLSRRGMSHNERFYEEQEYERRLRKRRARLIGATEEAFTHIKRLNDKQAPSVPLDCLEAAAAVFPSLARPLQKYLRLKREISWHTAESVLNHLATSLRLGLGPKAFLQRYLGTTSPNHVVGGERISAWALVSDISVSRTIFHGLNFLLKNSDQSLFVSITSIPHLNITEQVIDPKNNKFTLRMASETSV